MSSCQQTNATEFFRRVTSSLLIYFITFKLFDVLYDTKVVFIDVESYIYNRIISPASQLGYISEGEQPSVDSLLAYSSVDEAELSNSYV